MPVGFQEHRAFIGKNNVQPQNPKKRSVAIAQEQGDNLGELLGVLVDLYSENQQAGNQANGSNFNKKTVAPWLLFATLAFVLGEQGAEAVPLTSNTGLALVDNNQAGFAYSTYIDVGSKPVPGHSSELQTNKIQKRIPAKGIEGSGNNQAADTINPENNIQETGLFFADDYNNTMDSSLTAEETPPVYRSAAEVYPTFSVQSAEDRPVLSEMLKNAILDGNTGDQRIASELQNIAQSNSLDLRNPKQLNQIVNLYLNTQDSDLPQKFINSQIEREVALARSFYRSCVDAAFSLTTDVSKSANNTSRSSLDCGTNNDVFECIKLVTKIFTQPELEESSLSSDPKDILADYYRLDIPSKLRYGNVFLNMLQDGGIDRKGFLEFLAPLLHKLNATEFLEQIAKNKEYAHFSLKFTDDGSLSINAGRLEDHSVTTDTTIIPDNLEYNLSSKLLQDKISDAIKKLKADGFNISDLRFGKSHKNVTNKSDENQKDRIHNLKVSMPVFVTIIALASIAFFASASYICRKRPSQSGNQQQARYNKLSSTVSLASSSTSSDSVYSPTTYTEQAQPQPKLGGGVCVSFFEKILEHLKSR